MRSPRRSRLVVIGLDEEGRSKAIEHDRTPARIVRPSGAVVEELWRQESLPAHPDYDGTHRGEMDPVPPRSGASIRIFTVPANTPSPPPEELRSSPSLYVATVVSGEAYIVLEAEEVRLRAGDSLVLPGSKHGWRNDAPDPAVLVTTVFAME